MPRSPFKLVATKSAVSSSSVRKGSPLGPSFPVPEVANGPLLGHTFLISQVPTNQCFSRNSNARHEKFSPWTRKTDGFVNSSDTSLLSGQK